VVSVLRGMDTREKRTETMTRIQETNERILWVNTVVLLACSALVVLSVLSIWAVPNQAVTSYVNVGIGVVGIVMFGHLRYKIKRNIR
jgi:uncharacterized membrane protein